MCAVKGRLGPWYKGHSIPLKIEEEIVSEQPKYSTSQRYVPQKSKIYCMYLQLFELI